MKTQQQSNDKTEVYSVSGFRDTLASPVFYPVIVVAILLGVTSILGFVQNPLKLKSMVNVIHQKVAITNVVNGTLENKLYKVSNNKETTKIQTFQSSVSNDQIRSFDLFLDFDTDLVTHSKKMPVDKSIERIAFNYDVTSENFWTDLDSSKLETAKEEMERKQREKSTIGTPLEIDQQEKFPTKFKINDKSIYALSSSKKI